MGRLHQRGELLVLYLHCCLLLQQSAGLHRYLIA
jgi:hypothetical protein